MLPIVFGHEAKTKRWPYVTICLIGLNILVFAFEISLGRDWMGIFIQDWGMVPARIGAGVSLQNLLSVETSTFMHAGYLHLFFNMWFFYVFADPLEDALGHWWFLLLYLVAGFAGDMTHVAFNSASPIPSVGASGAIAGVMGATLIIWPRARLKVPGVMAAFFTWQALLVLAGMLFGGAAYVVVPFALFAAIGLLAWRWIETTRLTEALFGFMDMSAWFVLGWWLMLNVWNGIGSVVNPHGGGGVGWWAHIGGFAVGALFGWIFPKTPVALPHRTALE